MLDFRIWEGSREFPRNWLIVAHALEGSAAAADQSGEALWIEMGSMELNDGWS